VRNGFLALRRRAQPQNARSVPHLCARAGRRPSPRDDRGDVSAERAAHPQSMRGAAMELGIRNRRALLCGASRGLGRACALAVAREGVHVTIVARGRDTLERTAAEIRAASDVEVTAVAADITTAQGRAAALAACPEPDILLNNADGPLPGDFR